MKRIVLASLLLGAVLILGYGYWFNATHGSLNVTVWDVTDREHANSAIPSTISFLDSNGNVLAEAQGQGPWFAVLISSPKTYSCSEADWQTCFPRQSRWLPTWIRSVRYIDFKSGSCEVRRKPVVISEHPDTWWLWWVPLPHIGGKPYTSFNLYLEVNRNGCAITP